jgi:hypothetical protein
MRMTDTNARGRPRQPRQKTNTVFVGAYFGQLRRLEDTARRNAGRKPLSQATLADQLGTIQTVMQRFEQGDRGESLVPKLTEHWGVDANVINKLVLGQLPDGSPATVEAATELATAWHTERDHEFVEAAHIRGLPVRSKQEAAELFEQMMNDSPEAAAAGLQSILVQRGLLRGR